MNITIHNNSSQPIYQQIAHQVKNQILTGDLQQDDALPSLRSLAKELGVSVITTRHAYEKLESEGLIYSAAGKGTFVRAQNPVFWREEQLGQIKKQLQQAAETARLIGIGQPELAELLSWIWEKPT